MRYVVTSLLIAAYFVASITISQGAKSSELPVLERKPLQFDFVCINSLDQRWDKVYFANYDDSREPKIQASELVDINHEVFKTIFTELDVEREPSFARAYFDTTGLFINVSIYVKSRGGPVGEIGPFPVSLVGGTPFTDGIPNNFEANQVMDDGRTLILDVLPNPKQLRVVMLLDVFSGKWRVITKGVIKPALPCRTKESRLPTGNLYYEALSDGEHQWKHISAKTGRNNVYIGKPWFRQARYRPTTKLPFGMGAFLEQTTKSPDGRYIAFAIANEGLFCYDPQKPGSLQQLASDFHTSIYWTP